MLTWSALVVFFATLIVAQFSQEQSNGAIAAIAGLGDFGKSGEVAILASQSIQFLLQSANPCESMDHPSIFALKRPTKTNIRAYPSG